MRTIDWSIELWGPNQYRERFRSATAHVVKEVFEESLPKEGSILEIGSGFGELVKLAPGLEEKIQQSDISQRVAYINKSLNAKSNVHVADVCKLPYRDGTFAAVVGISVFDTLRNLEDVLMEVKRVLIPGGTFISFQDLEVSPLISLDRYTNSDFITFPLVETVHEGKVSLTGWQLVKRGDYLELQSSVEPTERPLINFYASNPTELFQVFDDAMKQYFDNLANAGFSNLGLLGISKEQLVERAEQMLYSVLRHISTAIEKSPVEKRQVRLNEQFQSDFELTLKTAGFSLMPSRRSGVVIVEANKEHRRFPQYNFHYNDLGFDKSRYDPELAQQLKPGHVKVRSDLYVVVAKR